MTINSIVAKASNVRVGTNPPFSIEDFLKIYPQFGKDSDNKEIVPTEVIDMYIQFADTCIQESRWQGGWKLGTALFVAHFCTLWVQSYQDPNHGANAVMQAAQTKGLVASKSVADLSISYDFSTALSDLDGWAVWKLTTFGVQLASMAKLIGKGGMYVW